jgi:O-antigen biosynthesis protein
MRVSIVTALFNRLDLTRAFLASLEAYPPPEPWEILWVDDGSTDGTREWLATLPAPRHRVILNSQNLGYAAANNLGAHAATSDTLAFLNNDLVLTPGWFAPLAERLSSIDRIGIVGNVQVVPASELIDHAGVFFDLVGRPGHRLKNRPPQALRGPGVFSRAVTAACWLVRREVFLGAGGFDEAYRNGSEDFDLCLRLGEAGLRHWVDYRSVIYHHVSSSPGRRQRDHANEARFLRRWHAHTSLWGREDWPREYLSRIARHPLQLNATKTLDASLRLLKLRHGDSSWAARLRAQLIQNT